MKLNGIWGGPECTALTLSEDDFATFDADSNGSLSSEEWMTGFGETEWFTTYDADANSSVSETEWNTGLWGDWDADGNGSINEDEFNIYSPYTTAW
ncbi:EF-hand domain-containing protein [Antarcticibacterium sp. 1MA-6-2]|uniref:EF-hand domain-containing protein n=1 Tax=Antarcticibacterium sp. 1MA-6-2 TaxID=2908210 RepID=UPI001F207585|nr:EF-hand domain-containing protein [Antarcticibacterium sp. 1MA-6-2]UJH89812.1 EF-hand domain-containing protein [Antarcticibacterium sp. 1MA-6-2]